ncbi:DNA topoisomerase IB [Microbacterium esteraromaticum]|uniref:DNA topoisomerase IB n=1 Tax=Microbacterium esteraromaticum TaxID=57043 RepID=UPI000B34BED3|nr:DNA topoisomerase IB [Microbacterium esteraromaticum]
MAAVKRKQTTSRRRRSPVITREATDDGFIYRLGGRKITKRSEIERIEALVIPPAWVDVEIARSASAKVLARGTDAAGRTQSIYHPAYRRRQERRKYDRMLRFARALPRLRNRVDRDLRRKRLNRDRVTACVIRLIDLQLFRVGNSAYAKQHRSYGVTTLRAEHLTATSSIVEFDFTGKSGKRQQRRVSDARVARLIAQLLELPGSDVFRFFDEDGVVRDVRSHHVNAYVKRFMGEEFTAKDFRTWGGTVLVATALLGSELSDASSERESASVLREAVKAAADRLGNTPAVTRSAYVDPRVLAAAEHPDVLERVRRTRVRPRDGQTAAEQRTVRLLTTMGAARQPVK